MDFVQSHTNEKPLRPSVHNPLTSAAPGEAHSEPGEQGPGFLIAAFVVCSRQVLRQVGRGRRQVSAQRPPREGQADEVGVVRPPRGTGRPLQGARRASGQGGEFLAFMCGLGNPKTSYTGRPSSVWSALKYLRPLPCRLSGNVCGEGRGVSERRTRHSDIRDLIWSFVYPSATMGECCARARNLGRGGVAGPSTQRPHVYLWHLFPRGA